MCKCRCASRRVRAPLPSNAGGGGSVPPPSWAPAPSYTGPCSKGPGGADKKPRSCPREPNLFAHRPGTWCLINICWLNKCRRQHPKQESTGVGGATFRGRTSEKAGVGGTNSRHAALMCRGQRGKGIQASKAGRRAEDAEVQGREQATPRRGGEGSRKVSHKHLCRSRALLQI